MRRGGIVPPLAQDLHREHITEVCEKALRSANLRLRDVDAIAATVKPGLPLSLDIGTKFGKYLSKLGGKPFIPIHHMEAHALTARMIEKVDFPFLVLLVSGGHCLLAVVKDVGKFYLLGGTIDDAPGEAFDKSSRRLKMRNIPDYKDLNGGAAIELAASRATDPFQFSFEPTMPHYKDCNFSFAGMKNMLLTFTKKQEKEYNILGDGIIPDLNNLCAGFQIAVARHVCHRTKRAMIFCQTKELLPQENPTLVVSGGVACNNFLAKGLNIVCSELGYKFVRPPPQLCTDNGIMIAWNGVEKWMADIGVLRDQKEINEVVIQRRAPLGEDWTEKVRKASISCKMIKPHQFYDS
ncbi:probable tRNA N6-adenosine threonylcarbamoyltransferase, mitochondrial isoform X2 [Venturia canescens]|uniref:probable tRNA N6-adenosine threonylcarbamoyltransferase, mitochondrial isoform X2 n=1 Tax=Venturia canescens TaxID=32260 RepID=UPI001C9C439A|nr:probable tRNA N6-adenosine threonylcarbamoyltransferase, mitochondrial isoform X2 [Venturia canescens]